ncbi:MAG: acetoin utilization deacetylase AcuC-like enzyme [Arenicella sp.]|jgi:acetoin utilization deacetylase AcuC-like enzyme
MQKFARLLEHLTTLGIAQAGNVYRPGKARLDLLELAHCPAYLDKFITGNLSDKEVRRMGLPWSEGLVKRSLISPNGTFLTASLALRHGIACHLAGGTHHAHYDFASGYCILNDLAIAALALVSQSKVQRVLIFDCDVHQGDGTATILQDVSEITTCSIHCEKNFPHRKAKSDIDIELPKGLGDQAYLSIVDKTLQRALEVSQPDLVIFDAGVDIFESDPLGMLNISINGIRARDRLVIETVRNLSIPLATVIGGGYDKDQSALARRHAIVIEEAYKYHVANQQI